eukprot:TRINITY_DN1290_c0_g2_i1.p1 TRINITY_DN1290_c0_g2~~TRINITY_DN1290_c0_g2_i1.p1  ORF type:complete len:972 (-),score=331.02 TRINITY_DN1290_c0_g2_i1:43-2811(-)
MEEVESDVSDQEEVKGKKKPNYKKASSGSRTYAPKERAIGTKSPAKTTKNSKSKYTPLELQFMAIKEKFPDTVLFVECGYKYKFFGDDAEIASKVLNIYANMKKNFMEASIPVHRLSVHLSRIVNAGYKVGVVNQTETAALKAVGSNKGGPFTRELTSLYTPGTMIGENVDSSLEMEDKTSSSYLMCLFEVPHKTSQKVEIGLVALQMATGELIYDQFSDDFSRSELETRIVQLQPAELLVGKNISSHSRKILRNLLATEDKSRVPIRFEDIDEEKFDEETAVSEIQEFFSRETSKDDLDVNTRYQAVMQLPKMVVTIIGVLIGYLDSFKLKDIFELTDNFRSFLSKKTLQLNGTTLSNLEVLTNNTNGGEKASLLWVMQHTLTSFGGRLMRKWISQPLIEPSAIEQRLDAVEEISTNCPSSLQNMMDLLKELPDLERGLCRIHYKKCGIAEFHVVLTSFKKIFNEISKNKKSFKNIKSKFLRNLAEEIPDMTEIIDGFMSRISPQAAMENKKNELFILPDDFPEVTACRQKIEGTQAKFKEHLKTLRKSLKMPSLDYTTKSGIEYQLEFKKAEAKKLSSDFKWTKISQTKAVDRFHTDEIIQMTKLLQQAREQLEIECAKAWSQFLSEFAENYTEFRNVVQQMSILDCLFSLAVLAKSNNYVKPVIVKDGPRQLKIVDGRNPIVEQLRSDSYVPNDTNMTEDGERCMIITGPNMGGKSSYMRQVAQIVIMAQIGSFVPASECRLSPVDAIYTRMGAHDNIQSGQSTFFVEMQQTAQMLSLATPKSLLIMDELGRGTSTVDGCSIAYSTLNFILSKIKCFTLFVTHYWQLTSLTSEHPIIVDNYHMAYLSNDDMSDMGEQSEKHRITFLYKMEKGPSERSYGLNVALMAGIPQHVVDKASQISQSVEENNAKELRKQNSEDQ